MVGEIQQWMLRTRGLRSETKCRIIRNIIELGLRNTRGWMANGSWTRLGLGELAWAKAKARARARARAG